MSELDHYDLLGVHRDASKLDIRAAYRSLAKTMHPDAGGSSSEFHLLRTAYETLNDPSLRTQYDRDLREDELSAAAPFVTSRTRPARRDRRAPRPRASFTEDPAFVPVLPKLDLADIPWWGLVENAKHITKTPETACGSAPTATVLVGGTLVAIPVLTPVAWSEAWIALAAVVISCVGWLTRHHMLAAKTDRELGAEFGDKIIFGRPGADLDQVGEQLTAKLLKRYLAKLPGIRIFHSLSWPGSVFADIDHAILSGNRLVLLESKVWPPGHYAVDEDGTFWRNDNQFRGSKSRLPEAIEEFQRLLPQVEICGAIVIYPNRAGTITTEPTDDSPIQPVTPQELVVEIGDWLATMPSSINKETFRSVLNQVVSH